MLQYLLTGLAGVALGIVAMRIWTAREVSGDDSTVGNAAAGGDAASTLWTSRNMLFGAGALVAIALAIFAFRGDAPSEAPGSPLAAAGRPDKSLDDVDTMIARLAARLEKAPGDGEGFRMLGWSFVMTGKPAQAIAPYKRALQLLPRNATVHAGYGEALVGVAGGKVTEEAKSAFDRALKLDPTEPRARHFEALWLAQNGQERQALDKWIALANSAPADAPWQADVRREVDRVAVRLGVDVSNRLKPPAAGALPPPDPAAVKAAGAMPEADRAAMIDGMVEGLAAKLAANPRNPDGWARLLRSRMVLSQSEQAVRDLALARKALAGDPAGLATIEAAAKDAGVPGA